MRLPHRYKVYNVLHKTTVYTLFGGTLLGMGLLGIQGYYYFKNVRPEKMEKSRIYLEEELAKEQIAKEQELLLKQRDAETLKN